VTFVLLTASFLAPVGANNFLRGTEAGAGDARISKESVRASLLEEIEESLGTGSAARRVVRLESALSPMYAALPKNEHGHLGHATVRYALHRLFVQRHAWHVNGLEPNGGAVNASTAADMLKATVPSYVQELFERRLGDWGFSLHDIAVFAATMEHFIHNETMQRLEMAYEVKGVNQSEQLTESRLDMVVDQYMKEYILGKDAFSIPDSQIHIVYPGWNDTQVFVREMRKNVQDAEADPSKPPGTQTSDFKQAMRVVEEVGDHYGHFQDAECRQIKDDLLKHADWATGRVKLSKFYNAALEHGHWQFTESADFLRQNGVLDESDPFNPQVIVTNYVYSPANCVASSSFYSVCCINECEGLLAHLEREIAAPEGEPALIAELVASLPTSTVQAPRNLSTALRARLDEMAVGHGTVPLHGRLFAQWMHHAFPRECPYPHVAGTTNPQTADEYMAETGATSSASEEEMKRVVEDARSQLEAQETPKLPLQNEELPWHPEEELLVVRPKPKPASRSILAQGVRSFFMFAALVSAAIGLVRTVRDVLAGEEGASKGGRHLGGHAPTKTLEKYLV